MTIYDYVNYLLPEAAHFPSDRDNRIFQEVTNNFESIDLYRI
jgi:hypothetical protein